jgi:hypothetical protein
MAKDPISADAAHAMQTMTRYPQQKDMTARGRFGRDVPGPAADDAQMADARTTMHSDDVPERADTMGYVIDPDAVAAAIIDRLMAGRTLPTRAEDA